LEGQVAISRANDLCPELTIRHQHVLGEARLRRTLKIYASYYDEVRTHLSLDKDAPKSRPSQKIGSIVAMPILSELHHQYVRI
jgi:hypothetical protein